MNAKISLAAAFFLMAMPPLACASDRGATNPAPTSRQSHQSLNIVVAQDSQSSMGTTNNDNDSADSSDDNKNDNDDQQNAAGDDQPMPPTVLNGPDNDPDSAPQFDQAPQPQPVNPYQ